MPNPNGNADLAMLFAELLFLAALVMLLMRNGVGALVIMSIAAVIAIVVVLTHI